MINAFPKSLRRIMRVAGLPLLALTSGCDWVVMNPSGDVAMQQRNLVLISTGLMLLIIVPVMALTILFAWRYRQGNDTATYDPDFDHSTVLELVIWSAPLLIIICLGALTWGSTHLLDPYRPIARTAPGRLIPANVKPLEVEVVALDWKWLFIYPQYGIATVNEMAAPVDRPIHFRITASSVMNSFYIPALAGQIYAMPGMQTTLNAVINKPGDYEGFSSNYSGAGFSGMRFRFHGVNEGGFDGWINKVRAADGVLDRPGYLTLEKPTEDVPAHYYGSVAPDLYGAILAMCVAPGPSCMSMATDSAAKAKGAMQKRMDEIQSAPRKPDSQPIHPPGNPAPGAASNRDISLGGDRPTLPGPIRSDPPVSARA